MRGCVAFSTVPFLGIVGRRDAPLFGLFDPGSLWGWLITEIRPLFKYWFTAKGFLSRVEDLPRDGDELFFLGLASHYVEWLHRTRICRQMVFYQDDLLSCIGFPSRLDLIVIDPNGTPTLCVELVFAA